MENRLIGIVIFAFVLFFIVPLVVSAFSTPSATT